MSWLFILPFGSESFSCQLYSLVSNHFYPYWLRQAACLGFLYKCTCVECLPPRKATVTQHRQVTTYEGPGLYEQFMTPWKIYSQEMISKKTECSSSGMMMMIWLTWLFNSYLKHSTRMCAWQLHAVQYSSICAWHFLYLFYLLQPSSTLIFQLADLWPCFDSSFIPFMFSTEMRSESGSLHRKPKCRMLTGARNVCYRKVGIAERDLGLEFPTISDSW